jgi:hypothetical protein
MQTGGSCTKCDGYGMIAPPSFASPPADNPLMVEVKAPTDNPLVVEVKAGTPRTAHLRLEEIFKNLAGEIRVCDPYYGMGSLLRLDLLRQCSPINVLTRQPGANEPPTLQRALEEWKREHGAVDFRRYSGTDVHDRFVLADDQLILIGHGLKDIGNKDSFVICIPKHVSGDLLTNVRVSFDAKWQNAHSFVT